ncbi:MAG: radical SAM protein [Deltaproteobacteria bacterium]|nr:radical SAM protein [Deltaproteobacteria bacterium]
MSIGIQNLWRMGAGTLDFHVRGVRRPLNVMLSVTDRCTYLCEYCKIPTRKSKEMSLDQLKTLFGQMRRAGTARLGIWGGEPLIRNDIGEILRAAKDQGFYVSVDTNGILVRKKLPELKAADHIVISFDGREENHDRNRTKGAHAGAMDAIQALAGDKRLWTITVLTKHNVGDVDYVLEQARKYNFLATFQVLHHNDLMGDARDVLAPGDRELREAVGRLIDAKQAGAPIANTVHYLRYLRSWHDYAEPTSKEQVSWLPCYAGDLFANIDTNGDLYPCSLTVGSVPTRNVLTDGFEGAFSTTSRMGCSSCDASCYVEYNHIHAMHPGAIIDFARAVALRT